MPTETAAPTVEVSDNGGPKKREAERVTLDKRDTETIAVDKWPQPTEFRS